MTEFWEAAFAEKQRMWGEAPAASAVVTSNGFARMGIQRVLIPGVGYGRNARVFLDRGMSVTGIEISGTAIALARSQLGLQFPIHHGPVADMPYDNEQFDGIFCHGLIHLLDAPGRAKLIRDCYSQLAHGGQMVFSAISKAAPMYGKGNRLGEDWYERLPGLPMYFYDAASIQREFGAHGLFEHTAIEEPTPGGIPLPFILVGCEKA